jgi:beta-ribofuranosylaminobenzene 5'-phosphate synthase
MSVFSAPCRLHFGLFHVPVVGLNRWPDGTPLRKFGGLGMMIRQPRIVVRVSDSNEFSASGSLAVRALAFAKIVSITSPRHVEANGPPEHIGLGVGTALGMATAHAIHGFHSKEKLPSLIGRGKRSGIGIYGYEHGGFIVDDGRLDDEPPSIRERIDVPEPWRLVLIRPSVPGAWHGERERAAFCRARSPDAALDTTRRLLKLANENIIPALKACDFESFTNSLTHFNRIAGEPFVGDQGGSYAELTVAEIVDQLNEWGTPGVGQSSWGPTVFAFARSEREAQLLADRVWKRFPNLTDVVVTAPDNNGVLISSLEKSG